ncbi:MAG TPA: redoxin domain-containing protein [Gaiellaceae bacterium]
MSIGCTHRDRRRRGISIRLRETAIIGLSVDSIGDHEGWSKDIEETQGQAPNYPIIGDADFNVSKLYGMLPAETSGDPKARTPADNQTVRNVFVIGPDKKVKLVLLYPMTTGRNFDEVLRVIDSLQLTAEHKVSTPVNWRQGEDVIIAGSVSNDEAKELFGSWEEPRPSPSRSRKDYGARCHLGAASVMPYVFVSCTIPRPFALTLYSS